MYVIIDYRYNLPVYQFQECNISANAIVTAGYYARQRAISQLDRQISAVLTHSSVSSNNVNIVVKCIALPFCQLFVLPNPAFATMNDDVDVCRTTGALATTNQHHHTLPNML